MSLGEHVRTLGRGPGRSRSLTGAEAEDAMALMLSGEAAPEAIGALLMLLRMKGEEATEIAGFVRASQEATSAPAVDLDWPSYAAGRTRGLPFFLLSARLVALTGTRVLLHGWNGNDGAVRAGLDPAGVARAADPDDAARLIERDGIAYLPLEIMSPPLMQLLRLREVLGLRSCVNTVCRMLNPGRAPAAIQGVFHPSYRLLQADAAAILGWDALSVIKGGGGEFERHPAKDIACFGLRGGKPWTGTAPALVDETRRLDDGLRDPARLSALWSGEWRDDFAEATVVGTATLALDTLGMSDPEALAQSLWDSRDRAAAA